MKVDKLTLGDIYDLEKGSVQTGPFGSQLHESDYRSEGIPVIMPKDIINDKLDTSEIARISEEDANRLSRHKVKVNDIVFPRRGDIGKRLLVNSENVGCLCGTGCIRLRGNGNILDPKFLFYYLKQASIVKWIENQAIGATMMNLNTSILRSIPIFLPPLPIQKKIASILSAYDELIENNNQRIQLLEEMAEEIYKEWFVRLRFPGRENTPIKDGVPEGWVKESFEDIAEFINGYAFKPSDWKEEGFPIIKIAELKNGVTEKTPRNNGIEVPHKYHVEQGELLFSWSADLEAYIWNEGQGLLNQHIFKVLPKKGISREFIFYSLKTKMGIFRSMSNGATMQHIKRSELGRVFLEVPTDSISKEFQKITAPILDEIGVLKTKNQILKETRDLLLPRLISGKLSVEHLLEEDQLTAVAAEPAG